MEATETTTTAIHRMQAAVLTAMATVPALFVTQATVSIGQIAGGTELAIMSELTQVVATATFAVPAWLWLTRHMAKADANARRFEAETGICSKCRGDGLEENQLGITYDCSACSGTGKVANP